MVKWVDVCTFGFLYSDGPVARPGDGPGRVQKDKSAKNERNQPGLPSIVMDGRGWTGFVRWQSLYDVQYV